MSRTLSQSILDDLVEYKTEYGSYWVTAEDAALLNEDMRLFGQIAVRTKLDGDRVIGRRVNPKRIFADLTDTGE